MLGPILKTSRQQAVVAREKFLGTVQKWQARDLNRLTPSELLAGVHDTFNATAEYYNMAQSATIPTSLTSEAVFGVFYNALIKHKGDPDAPTFLFGSENQAIRSEKALFDLTMWAKEQPELEDYLTRVFQRMNSARRFNLTFSLFLLSENSPPASALTCTSLVMPSMIWTLPSRRHLIPPRH